MSPSNPINLSAFHHLSFPPTRLSSFGLFPFLSHCKHTYHIYLLSAKHFNGSSSTPRLSSQKFIVASSTLLALSSISLLLEYPRMRLGSLLLLSTIILAYLALPAPQSLCLDTPSFKKAASSPTTRAGKLLARRQSVTGLVAVGEYTFPETGDEFRYLRCDHSLLGGIWTGPIRERARARGQKLDENEITEQAESIYATFVLQEAIRLVKRSDHPNPSALIIGLGIGVSARSLMRHGIQITVVEIDPAVYDYARQYFAMPKPSGGIFLQDAGAFVRHAARANESYDYVIHDVFTGGSVPGSLFTYDFWTSIRALLKSDGVLAVNFAGTPIATSGKLVLSTLFSVFPLCRLFTEQTDQPKTEADFQNLVVFCMPSARPEFRPPTEGDVFGSPHRLWILNSLMDYELKLSEISRPEFILKHGKQLEMAQVESAIDHWKVMRQVLEDGVWENYY